MPHDTKPPKRILAVDDNRTNLAILEELLGEEYQVKTATSGQECLEAAQSFQPDLVLLDIMMPGIDGYETCRRLRSNENLRHTKIVMVSAKAMLSERLEGYAAGADDYVSKPFDCDELLSKIRVYLRLLSVEVANEETRSLNQCLERSNAELNQARKQIELANSGLREVNTRLEDEVSCRKAVEDRLRHDALHDILTNLPNRALLSDRIDRCIQRIKRVPNSAFAVLFIDLDDFKVVNDSLGHRLGDKFLIETAHRLVSSLRATDSADLLPDGTTARIGGDEFVILLDGLTQADDASLVAQRLQAVLSEPILVEGHEIRSSASIGIAMGSSEYEVADEILRDADTALYRAKELGKRQSVVFDAEMRTKAVARLRMEIDLRRAIDCGELFVVYQAIVYLPTREIHGFEALLRWNHPELGIVLPNEFIPLAEQTGLITPLGRWVLRAACFQTVEWRKRFPQYTALTINVNFSGKQLANPGIIKQIDEALEETGLDRGSLNIELTESVLMENASPGATVLEQLSAKKTEIHMDDFGTGYSSLSYLTRLPISALKLDRSFVREMMKSNADTVTVRAVLDMAHSRGLKVIAEGVETADQAAWLQGMGCDYAQGYYFAKPVAADVVERMLASDDWARQTA